jgi:hypothetical protein
MIVATLVWPDEEGLTWSSKDRLLRVEKLVGASEIAGGCHVDQLFSRAVARATTVGQVHIGRICRGSEGFVECWKISDVGVPATIVGSLYDPPVRGPYTCSGFPF